VPEVAEIYLTEASDAFICAACLPVCGSWCVSGTLEQGSRLLGFGTVMYYPIAAVSRPSVMA
jgi:hypothetical protein